MSILQYSQKDVPRLVLYKSVHNCSLCPYKTKSTYFMMNHVRRHKAQLAPVTCKGDIEMYYCKDCNFQTELTIPFKKHIRTHHVRDESFIAEELGNFFCERCGFETKISYEWLKHMTVQDCKPPKQATQRICSFPQRCTESDKFVVENVIKGLQQEAQVYPVTPMFQWLYCYRCSYKTRFLHCLKRHKINCHLSKPVDFKNKDCFDVGPDKKTNLTGYNCYGCLKCPYRSPSKREMREHMKCHPTPHKTINLPNVQIYKCVKCPYRTQIKEEMVGHRKAHVIEEGRYSCLKCPYRGSSKKEITEHMQSHPTHYETINLPSGEIYKCVKCAYKTQKKEAMVGHMKAHVIEGGRYRCHKCTYRSFTKEEIIKHMEGHPKDKTINCTSAKLTQLHTSQTRKVEEHIKTLPTIDLLNKRFGCGKCTYIAQTRTALKEHLLKHQDVKRYICENCDFKTDKIDVFQTHVVRKHLNLGLGGFKCGHCGYESTNDGRIFEHLVKAPGSCSAKKVLQCDLCKFSTKENSNLKKHVFLQHFI